MEKEDTQVTAAACRYILVALLPRLEQSSPGLLAELRSGMEGDRQAMAVNGRLSPEVDAVVSEAQRILDLGGTL